MKRLISSIVLVLLSAAICFPQTISTVAGNGVEGYSGDGDQAISGSVKDLVKRTDLFYIHYVGC